MEVGENERARMDFVLSAISQYKATSGYKTALDACEYEKQRNTTISRYRKLLYDLQGRAVPDNWSANHKCASNFFNRFVTQEASYLLGNGVTFENDGTKERLGKTFDADLYKAGKAALVQGVSYGFYNYDHVEIFKALEFLPLYDEEDGAIKAGIRFWQVSDDKPLRATLYELDGLTEYIKRRDEEMTVHTVKRAYKQISRHSEVDGTRIYDGGNYPTFPIVPLWGNQSHQSELVGMRENIDCYDLIKSGFANDLDEASMIYWTLENTGGMSDIDLAKFRERMKLIRVADIDGDEGAKATAHTMEVPYQSRETYLSRLENDMYNDYMALNVAQIASGAVTATQIEAAYEPLNNKADEFEYCIIDFIQGLLAIAGVEDNPSFTRSKIVNQSEEIEVVLSAAEYLDDEFIVERICNVLGCPDKKDEILARRDAESVGKFGAGDGNENDDGEEVLTDD